MTARSRIAQQSVTTGSRRPMAVKALVLVLGVLVIGSLQGGVAMVSNPHTPLGMTTEYLQRSPVDTYMWPGLFLLGIAVASVVTMIGLVTDWQWNWARRIEMVTGHRWPWLGAVATGGVLLAFEILELYLIPFHPIMHPMLIAGTLTILTLTLAPSTDRHLRVPDDAPRGRK